MLFRPLWNINLLCKVHFLFQLVLLWVGLINLKNTILFAKHYWKLHLSSGITLCILHAEGTILNYNITLWKRVVTRLG